MPTNSTMAVCSTITQDQRDFAYLDLGCKQVWCSLCFSFPLLLLKLFLPLFVFLKGSLYLFDFLFFLFCPDFFHFFLRFLVVMLQMVASHPFIGLHLVVSHF